MSPLDWLLVAQVAVTMILAVVFLLRPSVTRGVTGKMAAFVALALLPALDLVGGMRAQNQRDEQTRFCMTCHAMAPFGRSLYLDNAKAMPASHFQNHRVPADRACYSCHADYTLFGPIKDEWRGAARFYMQYIRTPPKTITIPGGYNNRGCLHCHAGARDFEENPIHAAVMSTLVSNQLSCVSSGCHDLVHDLPALPHAKFWSPKP